MSGALPEVSEAADDSERLRDNRLAAAAQAGDMSAWAELARLHAPRLAGYLGARLRRVDVVDRLVEEAIYAGWRNIADYPADGDFAPWFRRIGAGLALRWHKRHKDERLTGELPAERCADDADTLVMLRRIDQALGKLPEKRRMALEQRFRGGISGPVLAEAIHCTPGDEAAVVDEALDALLAALADA